ncbi:AAA family ATPase [Pandoraea sp. SD6-2]|uniref:nucleotide-binding protein n=1 Tax=Pandoraea sp. SD6-2 TaxID=1286093 RepID=UPI000330AF42|nr:AAA family ATPase [Pandoraea sp. SD6-2]EON13729.1 response regulator receiver protein [Pandoraea sp. SD6-2]
MLKVLLASHAPERLALLARLVRDHPEYDVATLAATPAQLLNADVRLEDFDAAVVDLPGTQQGELCDVQVMCQQWPKLVCILVMHEATPALLIAAMRAGARDVLPWPLEQHGLDDALARVQSQHGQDAPRPLPSIAFMSCKGGAGTSFLAANFAREHAAQTGERVLLIDLDPDFGDAAFLVTDKAPPATLPQVCAQAERIDASFLDSCVTRVEDGFDALAGAGDPMASLDVTEESLKRILAAAAQRYDLVVFDAGRTVNVSVTWALQRSERVYVVLRASMPFLRAACRLFDLLRRLGVPMDKVGYLVNRSNRHDSVTHKELERALGMPALAVLPEDSAAVATAMSQGVPVARVARRSAIARALTALVVRHAAHADTPRTPPPGGESLFGRLWSKTHTTERATPPTLI